MNEIAPVVITRHIAASAERLFRAWTDPAVLVKWFFSAPFQKIAEFQLDLRPGGAFRIVVDDPEDRFCAFGEYQRIEPPHFLQFTWQWEESSLEKGVGLITVELQPEAEGTTLTLTHAKLSSVESAEAHAEGWVSFLGRLESYASTPEGNS